MITVFEGWQPNQVWTALTAALAFALSLATLIYTVRMNWGRRKRDRAAFELGLLPYVAALQSESFWTGSESPVSKGDLTLMLVNNGQGPAWMEGSPTLALTNGTSSLSTLGEFDNPVVPPGTWVAAKFKDVSFLGSDEGEQSRFLVEGRFRDVFDRTTAFSVRIGDLGPNLGGRHGFKTSHLTLDSDSLTSVRKKLGRKAPTG